MSNIITEHDVHNNHRVFSLASHVIDSSSIYKISENGDISKKLVFDHDEYEDYVLYKDCGRVLYLRKGFTRYRDQAIKINNSNYVNATKNLNINQELLAIRNSIFEEGIIQHPESHVLHEKAYTFVKHIYDIIKVTDKKIKYRNIENLPFNIFKIAYENDDLTISLYYEFQCFELFNNPWYIQENFSDHDNVVWNYASKYMSHILDEPISLNTMEGLEYYVQIYKTRIY